MNWLLEETRRLDDAVAKFRREFRVLLVWQLVWIAVVFGGAAILLPSILKAMRP